MRKMYHQQRSEKAQKTAQKTVQKTVQKTRLVNEKSQKSI
jgi:hypothetical protein